jgi:hypothetical protein
MRQFEQDWLELGSRVARSLHYQHPRNLRLIEAAKAERAADHQKSRTTPSHGRGHTPDTTTTIVGNLTDDPGVRSTDGGIARAVFGSPSAADGSRSRRSSPSSWGAAKPSTRPSPWPTAAECRGRGSV